MLKRSWIVGAFAMLLGCSMTAYGAMAVGTARRPEPKVEVIAEELQISGDYYSDPINAVGYDAISISADWDSDVRLVIEILARNAVTEEFRVFAPEATTIRLGNGYRDSGYFLGTDDGRNFIRFRCPQIQIHMWVEGPGSGTANVSIYME